MSAPAPDQAAATYAELECLSHLLAKYGLTLIPADQARLGGLFWNADDAADDDDGELEKHSDGVKT